jgi:hypothetical protein
VRGHRAWPYPVTVADLDEIWVPLVDEPIGSIVDGIQAKDPQIEGLVDSPRKLLAFKTFAYIRVGQLLGELLVDHDVDPTSAETWVEQLLRDPAHHTRVVQEVRAVAEEIAADPKYADEEPLGPDEDARRRFRDFARKRLESI